MGLGKIFIFSALSGISFAFSYRTGQGPLQTGLVFALLDTLNRSGDPNTHTFVMIVSIVATIFFIYSLSVFFRQIYENRLAGIITAVVGFAGSFVIMSSSEQDTQLIFLGIGLLIAGIVIARLLVRKN
jgi:hypothetical protein